MDKPELVDMWLLRHPKINDPSLPDCVCFERTVTNRFVVCQYSSRQFYDYANPPSNGIYSLPVHLVRCDTTVSRDLWDGFISDGWIPMGTVTPETPERCETVLNYLRACKYRDVVSNMFSWDHFTCGYPDYAGQSDLPSEFFRVSEHPNGIDSYHPVTRMPRLSRIQKRKSSRKIYTHDTYALEA